MNLEGWIERLAHDGEAMAVAVERADLDARVPTCPDWNVRDLTRHLGMVHRWATGYVAERRTQMWEVDDDGIVGTWPSDEDIVDWFRTGHRALVRALADADPDIDYWTFLQAPTPLSMWARRQAHETAVHRVDAELVTGMAPSFPPAFAADGIDELLVSFITRRRTKLTSDPPRTMRVMATDADGDWLVTIGPDGVTTTAGAAADVTISGPASELYLALWNRCGVDGLEVTGDHTTLDLFRDRVHIRWS